MTPGVVAGLVALAGAGLLFLRKRASVAAAAEQGFAEGADPRPTLLMGDGSGRLVDPDGNVSTLVRRPRSCALIGASMRHSQVGVPGKWGVTDAYGAWFEITAARVSGSYRRARAAGVLPTDLSALSAVQPATVWARGAQAAALTVAGWEREMCRKGGAS